MKLAPNRIAVYVAGAGSLATAAAPLVADLDLTTQASTVAGLAALVSVVYKFLTGWQNYEAALYQRDLITAHAEASAEARAQVSKPGGKPINVTLPR